MASLDRFLTDSGTTRTRSARPKSDGKRQQIQAAALEVMLEHGVYNATTRKIADAASVSVATLHYHFNDRDEIIFSVMVNFVESYRATLAEQFSADQTLSERVGAVVPFICGEIRKGPLEQLLLQEMTTYMLRELPMGRLANAKDQHFQSLYFDAFSNVRDRDAYSDENIRRVSNLIYTSLVGMFNQWLATQDDALIDRAAADLVTAAQGFAATVKS